jgi:mannose-6-phosphate isomerase
MWYILEVEKDAELITGFNREMTPKTYLDHLNGKKLKDILNVEKAAPGDVFYIPSGRVHALGPGVLLAEIQQTSDTTYRIYDWDRTDEKGNSRELHTDLAMEAIDFHMPASYRTSYPKVENKAATLVETPHFTSNILDFNQPVQMDYSYLDSFIVFVCVEGAALVTFEGAKETITRGESILLPASMENILLVPSPKCKLLEVFIP